MTMVDDDDVGCNILRCRADILGTTLGERVPMLLYNVALAAKHSSVEIQHGFITTK